MTGTDIILRAEFFHNGNRVVGSSALISEASAFVETDYPANVGDQFEIHLSFPGLLAPVTIAAHVVSKRLDSAPGTSAGLTIGFVFRSAAQEEWLRGLLSGDREDQSDDAGHNSFRVLLVDDNRLVCDVFAYGLRKYFGDRPLTIDVAADGQEAWAVLEAKSYDLVVVDYYLPVLKGDRLIARMREHPHLAKTPVIAISVGGASARSATLDAGADMFLAKPIVMNTLFRTLARLTRLPAAGADARSEDNTSRR